MKDKTTAGILAIFLGSLGVHKFYLNQVGLGVLYVFLSTFTCGLFAIVGFIEGLILLLMDQHHFDLKYNPEKFDGHVLGRNLRPPTSPSQKRRPEERVRPESDPRHAYEPDPAAARRKAIQKKKAQNPHKVAGIRKFRDYDFKGAKKEFKKALAISDQDIAVHFNLACCYSMEENLEKALQHLSNSVGLGFSDFDKIHKHDSLAFVRSHDEFDDFVKNKYRLVAPPKKDEPKIISPPKKDIPKKKEEETPDFDLLEQLSNQKEKEKILLTDDISEKEINSHSNKNSYDDIFNDPPSSDGKKGENESLSDDLLNKLKQLGELKEKGILNEQEFQEQKKRLLG